MRKELLTIGNFMLKKEYAEQALRGFLIRETWFLFG